MAICQYFGQVDCTAPVFGGGTAATGTISTPPFPQSVLSFVFGNSPLGWVVSGLVYFLLIRLVVWPFFLAPLLDLVEFRRITRSHTVLLELLPPVETKKSAYATAQLFRLLYTMNVQLTLKDRLLRRRTVMALEVVSTRSEGIRFLARVRIDRVTVFEQTISAYIPDMQCSEAEDYLLRTDGRGILTTLMGFRQAGHFAYPLKAHEALSEHDPIAYITGSMAQTNPSELLVYQIVLSPALTHTAVGTLRGLLAHKDPNLVASGWRSLGAGVLKTVGMLFKLARGIVSLLPWTGFSHRQMLFGGYRSDLTVPNLLAPELRGKMVDKLTDSLFLADVRVYIATDDEVSLRQRVLGLAGAFATFRNVGYQALIVRKSWPSKTLDRLRWFTFANRLPSLLPTRACVFSAEELAGLYHFPYNKDAAAENLSRSLSRTLAAPALMKATADKGEFDVVLGVNEHHGNDTPIGLTAAERERHVYIVGGTGNGKTTMLQYAIVQDIRSGKGLAIIDPHGDLATTILAHVPEDRVGDVIYFNPDDIDNPIGMNLLELPPDLSDSALVKEKDRVTESVISVLRKVFSTDDSGSHRVEYILRNAIHTALTLPDPTIFTVFELLTNDHFRNAVVQKLPRGTLKNFWKNELGKAGNMQRVKMSAGVTAKIGRFEFSAATKRVMGAPRSTINFDEILSSNKILICNFSKGRLGEDTSALFGTTVLAKLQLAAFKRERLAVSDRQPFYLYVDEFQNFATMPFVQMLSEARKYKLFLIMAEQSTSQQDSSRLVDIILSNVGTVACFRTGSQTDEQLLLPLFKPFIKDGEISKLPAYSFYALIASAVPQEPISGKTLLLEDIGNAKITEQVIKKSRQKYAYRFSDQPTMAGS